MKENEGPRRYESGIFVLLVAVYLVCTAAYCWVVWRHARTSVIQDVDERIKIVAEAVPHLLAPDFQDRAVDAHSISLGEELENRRVVNDFARRTGMKFIQTIVEKNGLYYLTAPTVSDEEAQQRTSWYFYPYEDIPDEFKRALRKDTVVYKTFEDRWGDYRAGAIAKVSPGGKRYLVEVDYDIAFLMARQRRALLQAVATAVFFGAILLPFVLFYIRYTHRLKRVNKDLTEAKGKLEHLMGIQREMLNDSERNLDASLSRLEVIHALFQSVPSVVLIFNAAGRIVDANRAAIEQLGIQLDPKFPPNIYDILGEQFMSENSWMEKDPNVQEGPPCEVLIRKSVSLQYLFRGRIGRLPSIQGTDAAFYVTLKDVTESKRREIEVEAMGLRDLLTGLPNRSSLLRRLSDLMRQPDASPALFVLNVSGFKRINDMYGIRAGDAVLKLVASRIEGLLEEGDQAFRLGGDEFALLSSSCPVPERAKKTAARIMRALKDPLHVHDQDLHVAGSLGVAIAPEAGSTPEELMVNCGIAVTAAKRMGPQSVSYFSSELKMRNLRRIEIHRSLRAAIEEKAFDVVFQPIMDLEKGAIVSVEAFTRWRNPEFSEMGPVEFVKFAEDFDLIVDLSSVLLEKSLEGFGAIFAVRPDMKLSVNVSSVLLREKDLLIDMVESRVANSPIERSALTLEVAEGAFMGSAKPYVEVLRGLSEKGYRISIDNVGMGNLPIMQFQGCAVSEFKIDSAYIKDIDTREEDSVLVQTILRMAGVLDIDVVAKGVEKANQADVLKRLHCPYAQGYFFHRPQTAEQILQLLR